MRFLYGMAVLCAIMGLAGGVIAESHYTTLVGTWKRFGTACTPCLLEINQVKDDGQLVAKYFALNSWIEASGRALMKRKKIAVNITLADGSRLELELSKKGNDLVGFAVYQTESGVEATVSFRRVTK